MGLGVIPQQARDRVLKRSDPERAIRFRSQSIHGELAHRIRAMKSPSAALLGALEKAVVGADPQVTRGVAHDAPYPWIGQPFVLGKTLPLVTSQPTRQTVPAITNPDRTLAIFKSRDHSRMLQAAFHTVVPAIVALAYHQPCVVRNQHLSEAGGHQVRAVGGGQLRKAGRGVKSCPGRFTHQDPVVGPNPQAPGGVLRDARPAPRGRSIPNGPFALPSVPE